MIRIAENFDIERTEKDLMARTRFTTKYTLDSYRSLSERSYRINNVISCAIYTTMSELGKGTLSASPERCTIWQSAKLRFTYRCEVHRNGKALT